MNIFIADNDVLICEHLAQMVASFDYKVVGIAHDKTTAIEGIAQTKPDIVLLDIRLETHHDGIEAAEYIVQNLDTKVIFVTAHSEIEIINKALKTNPLSYIIKPFSESEIFAALQIASKANNTKQTTDYMFVRDNFTNIKIMFDDIIYLKADNNYTEIVTKTKTFNIRSGLQEMMQKIENNGFMKVHRSYIINRQFITKYKNNTLYLNDMEIPVSRKYIKTINDILL